MVGPTLALLRTRLAIGSGFGTIGNICVQDELAPCFSGKEFEEFVVIAGHASNGSMRFVVILRLMHNADIMIAFGAGGSDSANATNCKPLLGVTLSRLARTARMAPVICSLLEPAKYSSQVVERYGSLFRSLKAVQRTPTGISFSSLRNLPNVTYRTT